MTRYQQLAQKALGIAFIIAPLLLVIGASVYLLGVERSPDGTSSWVEGMFMGMAFILFVPVYLELCRKFGEDAPLSAIICAACVVGFGYGVVPASHRVMQATLADAGINESVWALATHTGAIPSFLWFALGILASIVLSIAFLRNGKIPRFSALLLIITPILFMVGQGGDESIASWQIEIVYPLACVLWLIALAPIGWHYLTDSKSIRMVEQTRAVSG